MTYCIIDLEFCSIPPQKRISQRLSKEIIQLACVFMNDTFDIIGTFNSFVKPSYGGLLDKYVSDLTGIKSSDLANAPSAKQVIEHLSSLVDQETYFVTWSEHDCKQLEIQLDLELYSTGRELNVSDCFIDSLYDYIDVQAIFGEIMHSTRKYRLSEALYISNIDCCEKHHDALADALNTAKMFKKTQVEENFTFSPYFVETSHYNPFRQKCFA